MIGGWVRIKIKSGIVDRPCQPTPTPTPPPLLFRWSPSPTLKESPFSVRQDCRSTWPNLSVATSSTCVMRLVPEACQKCSTTIRNSRFHGATRRCLISIQVGTVRWIDIHRNRRQAKGNHPPIFGDNDENKKKLCRRNCVGSDLSSHNHSTCTCRPNTNHLTMWKIPSILLVLVITTSTSSLSQAFLAPATTLTSTSVSPSFVAARQLRAGNQDTPETLPDFKTAEDYLKYMESVSALPKGFATGTADGTFVSVEAPSLGNLKIRGTIIYVTAGPTDNWAACFTSNKVSYLSEYHDLYLYKFQIWI